MPNRAGANEMEMDHNGIEALLAGYVLLALSGEDALEADQLLSGHATKCGTCQATLAGFQAVAGELGLAADPVPPSDLLLSTIRSGLVERPRLRRRNRRAWWVVAAAALAPLLTLAAPSSPKDSLVAQAQTEGDFGETLAANADSLHIACDGVPALAAGFGYQVWVGANGTIMPVGRPLISTRGILAMVLTLPADTSHENVMISEESDIGPLRRPAQVDWVAVLARSESFAEVRWSGSLPCRISR